MKTRLVPQINRDSMTSTWLGRSCDLRETLIGGRLHCANISPAVPRPSPNYLIHKQRKDIKILFPGKYFINALSLHPKRTHPSAALPELCLHGLEGHVIYAKPL